MDGAFETQYQTAPLDLELDIFYNARKALIEERLEEIARGDAREIASAVDEIHRESKTFFVGSQWDHFSRDEILEILEVSTALLIFLNT
jgi:fanconi-associated nuclease 1